jgi:hypothetical protein
MRKTLALVACIALVALLAMPAAALARGHAYGRATAPGQVKKQEPVESPAPSEPDEPATDPADSAESEPAIPPGHEKANGNGHETAPGLGHDREQLGADDPVVPDVPGDWGPSDDASGTPDPKRVGIERALERLEANLARAEEKMADGSKWQLPPGLVKTVDKFMLWLGVDDEPVEDPSDDGSDDTSETPEPGDGSAEETETPIVVPPPPNFT